MVIAVVVVTFMNTEEVVVVVCEINNNSEQPIIRDHLLGMFLIKPAGLRKKTRWL